MTPKEIEEIKNKAWREGYDLGTKNTLGENKKTIRTREVKFRAWHTIEKEMLHNFWLDSKDGAIQAWKDTIGTNGDGEQYSQDYILMQYTGFRDKNGKEIYEGDIVKIKEGAIFEVKWFAEKVMYCLAFIPEGHRAFNLTSTSIRGYEIMGNIYENPELLSNQDK